MRDILLHLSAWLAAREPFALATVTSTSGSAPRAAGACLLVSGDGQRFAGAVSSGCLEQEVVAAAQDVVKHGGVRRLRFGPDAQPPWHDGLTCGGWIEVRVEPWWGFLPGASGPQVATQALEWLDRDRPGVVLSDDHAHAALGAAGEFTGETDAFDEATLARARHLLSEQMPTVEIAGPRGPVLLRSLRRRPRLLLIGATDVAATLAAIAPAHEFVTSVVDPRRNYVAPERFPTPPDHLLHAWPQRPIAEFAPTACDAAIALTHDPKIDDVALQALLQTPCGYIGALGSMRSHASRLERLRALGLGEESLTRIHGPAGLHLGTPDAAGIALGILAGLAQWRAASDRERREEAKRGPVNVVAAIGTPPN